MYTMATRKVRVSKASRQSMRRAVKHAKAAAAAARQAASQAAAAAQAQSQSQSGGRRHRRSRRHHKGGTARTDAMNARIAERIASKELQPKQSGVYKGPTG